MRGEFTAVGALALGLAAGMTLLVPVARGDARAPTIDPSEIKEGMKGYGLTVFKGTEPEKFDVEVIGVLHNFRPSQPLILVKTPHPRLNITKNVQGMSGSPIYLDGRLAGAYAYSLRSYQIEPVAGVTPIGMMLDELHRPIPPGFFSKPEGPGGPLPMGPPMGTPDGQMHGASSFSDARRYDGAPGEYDLDAHAAELATRFSPVAPNDPSRTFVPSATPLLVSGMGERTTAYVRKLFEPLGLEPLAAGGGEGPRLPGDPTKFVDGGSLGVWLVRGDMSIMGTGTVTHVEGDKLCGFGHPMLEGGDSELPAALARVLWIYASEQHSFKVAESIGPLGALIQDRPTAVVIDSKRTAPMFPVDITINGDAGIRKKNWHMEIAYDRFMSPGLATSAIGSAIEESINEKRDVTWKLSSKLAIHGHGTLQLDDFGVAVGGMPDAGDLGRSQISRALGDLTNNPWENIKVDSVESVMTVAFERDLWRLRGVDVSDGTVDAGSTIKLTAHLVPFVGPETTRTIDVAIPRELAGKDVDLEVIPGYEVPVDVAAPESLAELLANETRQTYTPRSLVVQMKLPGSGVAYRGHVAESLPSFAVDALRPTSGDVAPEALPSYARTVTPLDRYVEGRDKIRIKVRQPVR